MIVFKERIGISSTGKKQKQFLEKEKVIFVTVGTHEQPFDRLLRCVDGMKEDGRIREEVIMQTGYSTYEPKFCQWQKLYSYQQMQELVDRARIVITHGGPSSFIMPLQIGKIPIVVPRRHEFNEHVNNHQVEFCRIVAERMGSIILVEEAEQLGELINRYDDLAGRIKNGMTSNNAEFNAKFSKIAEELFEDRFG